jgi:hypothetical protein
MILLAFKSTSKKASLSFCFTFQFYELIVNLQKWFFLSHDYWVIFKNWPMVGGKLMPTFLQHFSIT